MQFRSATLIAIAGIVSLPLAAAAAPTVTTTINLIDATGAGAAIGSVGFEDTDHGLAIHPDLTGLPPGPHGFHIHEKPNCGLGEQNGQPAAGFAAGGHFDPAHTGKHLGPDSEEGHKGDLPVLVVDPSGKADTVVVAPHLTVADLKGHSVMIHAGGDNYSDDPKPLGGGGARIACGVIE